MLDNKKGNIMLGILFFVISMGIVIALVPVMNTFIGMAQQSNGLNCYGYVYNGDPNATLSFNATLNGGSSGNGMACAAIKLYLPYILVVFLIFGVSGILYQRADDFFTGGASYQ